jgi:hypothetical protein
MIVDGTEFDEFKIKTITMDLDTCSITFKVIFHKDKQRVTRVKEFTYESECYVDVNKKIKQLEQDIYATNIL